MVKIKWRDDVAANAYHCPHCGATLMREGKPTLYLGTYPGDTKNGYCRRCYRISCEYEYFAEPSGDPDRDTTLIDNTFSSYLEKRFNSYNEKRY